MTQVPNWKQFLDFLKHEEELFVDSCFDYEFKGLHYKKRLRFNEKKLSSSQPHQDKLNNEHKEEMPVQKITSPKSTDKKIRIKTNKVKFL